MQAASAEVVGNIKPWIMKFTNPIKSTDAKYFTTTKKGEIFELKSELCSDKKEKRKDAVKKIIACMTVGKDVSALFSEVLSLMQTNDLELKKLIHLYLINHARSNSELALMAVNTFAKDCDDPNPLMRALTVRTMGSLHVDGLPPYLFDPLRKSLKDEDPYVRKTAALCVAKLHNTDPQLVEESGFLELLVELLSDSNGMVVANAVAAISEISEAVTTEAARSTLTLTKQSVTKLLTALNECSEWGQASILDALGNYSPQNAEEAIMIMSRTQSRLAHTNPAVVLSTAKISVKFMDMLEPNSEVVMQAMMKVLASIITLLSAEPEIQYVALRILRLIVQKQKNSLPDNIKFQVFFVKYNDPIFVKLEKLDIMTRLVTPDNAPIFLSELKEYANEVDVDIVRKAVRAMGSCAIKIPEVAERCVKTLMELIQTKVNYIVQEAIVVIKDIFRRYPNRYESIVSSLCDNLDTLDEPEARASMIWIIGEYAERIDNADELLESFLQGFQDESSQVQLQLLTAIVKLFLKKPQQSRELVQTILAAATQESDNPDLRDRGYIYWRLLSTDPNAAKEVVLCERPLISDEIGVLEPPLRDELLGSIPSLASVLHRPPRSFVEGRGLARQQLAGHMTDDGGANSNKPTVIPTQGALVSDLLDIGFDSAPPPTNIQHRGIVDETFDLFSGGSDDLLPSSGLTGAGENAPSVSQPRSDIDALSDLFAGFGTCPPTFTSFELPMEVWLTAKDGKSLEIKGTFVRPMETKKPHMKLVFVNCGLSPMNDFAIQFNGNSFGLAPDQPLNIPSLAVKQSFDVNLSLNTNGRVIKMDPLLTLQVAVKNNVGPHYFTVTIPMHVLFVEDGELDKKTFLATWGSIESENERKFPLNSISLNADQCSLKLQQNNVFTVARRPVDGHDMLYLSLKLTNHIIVLGELKIPCGSQSYTLSLKSKYPDVCPGVGTAIAQILSC